jgi:putative transposase
VHAVVRALDPGLVVLAHDGPVRYRERYELVYRREASAPNEIWQADHTQLDILIVDEHGRAVRPWLTVIEDDHSRAIAGYVVFVGAPSALQTALALRQAIWRKPHPAWPVCEIPDILYCDHGSDFTSRHIDAVCADLHTHLVHSTAGVPQGRGKLERLFATITSELLCGLPGWLALGSAKPATAPALSLAELDGAIGRSSLRTTASVRTPRPRSRPPGAGPPAAGCRGCPSPWSSWTCCCCASRARAWCTATASALRASATRGSHARRVRRRSGRDPL